MAGVVGRADARVVAILYERGCRERDGYMNDRSRRKEIACLRRDMPVQKRNEDKHEC